MVEGRVVSVVTAAVARAAVTVDQVDGVVRVVWVVVVRARVEVARAGAARGSAAAARAGGEEAAAAMMLARRSCHRSPTQSFPPHNRHHHCRTDPRASSIRLHPGRMFDQCSLRTCTDLC